MLLLNKLFNSIHVTAFHFKDFFQVINTLGKAIADPEGWEFRGWKHLPPPLSSEKVKITHFEGKDVALKTKN